LPKDGPQPGLQRLAKLQVADRAQVMRRALDESLGQ
jgi:hypothetical protein